MATKMERAGRWLDIVLHIDNIQVSRGHGCTVGEYANFRSLGKSPYLYREFKELVGMGILYEKVENYKATIRKVYWVHYDNIAEFYPEIHAAITAQNGQLRLL